MGTRGARDAPGRDAADLQYEDVAKMVVVGRRVRALGAAMLVGCALSGQVHAQGFSFASQVRASDDARYAASWVLDLGDHQNRPFAIVDKKDARIHVFDADGRWAGSSPVLIGLAAGDASIPDIATRTPASLQAFERTTPAGRFASQPGHNAKGEDIVWIDYDASLAIHRLRPAPLGERRPERLASGNAAEHRISLGCVIVPVEFYDGTVAPLLGKRRGVVYVLPESRPVREMFGAVQVGSAR